MSNRRDFLKALAAGAVVASEGLLRARPVGAWQAGAGRPGAAGIAAGWDQLPAVLARIKPPVFAGRDFPVTRFGATGDNTRDNTDAFRDAIAACSRAGGGRVVVPEGEFLTGAIRLLTNVALHVEAGATIRFMRDPAKYPVVLTRFEGNDVMNYSPFIYSFEQDNIGITGSGTIDGNAGCANWWPWKGATECMASNARANQKGDSDALRQMGEKDVPPRGRIFGSGHYLRPMFIEPYGCRNVLIEGVTLLNSPMWHLHPVLCTNVTVTGLHINSSGPNTDGCNPESCTDVLIRNCDFNTGDDCIAIKSGRNADGRRLATPSQNIVIQGCHMRNGHGGVTIGSEDSGGVRNVFAENCRMDSPKLDFAVRIKDNAMRGGLVENIYVRNIDVGQVANAAVTIDFYYEEAEAGRFTPIVRHVEIRNLKSSKAKYALYLRGFRNAPIRDISLIDCRFDNVQEANVVENVMNIDVRNVRINGTLVNKIG
ncbi:MAG TPA: glycoside hydrolase family 28 protein [Vicinamibacterales bacterium]|nr:glycoside hydrolase family 28 protein [Vicinamibacterales bacterium]